ncbi:hydroxyisourate hydrolase [Chroococcidiopsis sp. FACHB-1243]|uniref:hydroxyisourate hydrolase n=1 Tax=Chroococcidiopsis sp. [FACHB-1243] TaxID=2692781 RepID=UPI0017851660|nr:hydroxyisourate hydrolase [Chroococcidiopsis sp. [FACHB-1243]]MBD2307372.1 hydroxyisourate hydrolase [Chroococcidiopsis sp. [FACHB-1243]]
MVGKLTTHVLDTAQGYPARQMKVELWLLGSDGERQLLKTIHTNKDGRTDTPLLADEELKTGIYELIFSVGDYFAKHIDNLPQPAFLNRVPLQFGIADPNSHYHVPLLVSPWSYSTYRGS